MEVGETTPLFFTIKCYMVCLVFRLAGPDPSQDQTRFKLAAGISEPS